MRRLLGALMIVLVHGACASAHAPPYSLTQSLRSLNPDPPPRGATASVSATSLRVSFPRIPLDSLGCGTLDTIPDGREVRRYYFLISNEFPSSRYPDNHFMSTGAGGYLPASAVVTPARLDSLLRVSEIMVDQAGGEPPMTMERTRPTFAEARFDGTRVVMEITGDAAIRAFVAAGRDNVMLGWCERGDILSFLTIPLRTAWN